MRTHPLRSESLIAVAHFSWPTVGIELSNLSKAGVSGRLHQQTVGDSASSGDNSDHSDGCFYALNSMMAEM
jgi:hypothetical protein